MPGSPGFKKCIRCKDPMPASDGHDACIRCLGESHVPGKCAHCSKLTARARKDRDMRLKLILFDKALQPSEAPQRESSRTLEKTSPPCLGSTQKKSKRVSPARSLAAAPRSRISEGDQPGTSGVGCKPAKHRRDRGKSVGRSSSAPAPSTVASSTRQPSAPMSRERHPIDPADHKTSAPPVRKHATAPQSAPAQPSASTNQTAPTRLTPAAPDAVPSDSHASVSGAAPHALKEGVTEPAVRSTPVSPKAPESQLPSPSVSVPHSPILLSDDDDRVSRRSPDKGPVPTKAQRKSLPRRSSPSPSPKFSPAPSPSPPRYHVPGESRYYHASRSPYHYSRPHYTHVYRHPTPHFGMRSPISRSPSRSPSRSYGSRYSVPYSSRRPSPDYSYHRREPDYSPYAYSRSRSPHSCRCRTSQHEHQSPVGSPQRSVQTPKIRAAAPSPPPQISDPEEGQISDEDAPSHAISPQEVASSSPDEAVFQGNDSPPDDSREFQDLFKRVADTQNVHATDVQMKHYKLLKNLHPKQQSRAALPIDEAILEPASEIWHTPASVPPTSKRVEKRYFVPSKGLEFLFTHPQPNSLIVDAALNRAKNPQARNATAEKEAKKLDIFGRKVYSSSTLLLRIANYAALLSNHGFDNIAKLSGLAQNASEEDKAILRAVVQEGYACSRASLQIAMDVADTAARSIATAISMRRASWLAAAGAPRDLQAKVEDLPFDKLKLFADKTDELLHTGKDSRTTLRMLGMYVPPFRRRRFFPYQRRYDFQFQRQQPRPFDHTRSKQRPQRRRPQPSRANNHPQTKQQV